MIDTLPSEMPLEFVVLNDEISQFQEKLVHAMFDRELPIQFFNDIACNPLCIAVCGVLCVVLCFKVFGHIVSVARSRC